MILTSPWRNSRRHSTGAASLLHPNAAAALGTPRLAALLLPQIWPDLLGRRALRSGRIAGLVARRDLHHGCHAPGRAKSASSLPRSRAITTGPLRHPTPATGARPTVSRV